MQLIPLKHVLNMYNLRWLPNLLEVRTAIETSPVYMASWTIDLHLIRLRQTTRFVIIGHHSGRWIELNRTFNNPVVMHLEEGNNSLSLVSGALAARWDDGPAPSHPTIVALCPVNIHELRRAAHLMYITWTSIVRYTHTRAPSRGSL